MGAIIVAAGESRRMGNVDKIFTTLFGLPLITHTVEAFERCPLVRDIVLVLSPDNLDRGQALAEDRGWRKVVSVCQGGERRQDSVRLGLERLPDGRNPWIVIHDGARPCFRPGHSGAGTGCSPGDRGSSCGGALQGYHQDSIFLTLGGVHSTQGYSLDGPDAPGVQI